MMKNRLAALLAALMALIPVARAEEKKDYSELSKLIQQAAVEKCPKRFEDRSEWGRTIPIPPAVRMPRLRRTIVQVDGRDEVPDGTWKRTLVWFDDPARDITIRVLDIQQLESSRFRVRLEGVAAFHGERERKRWRNGVQLLGLAVQADARVAADLTCEVKISLDASKLPPEVVVEPKVIASRLELRDFDLNRVGNVLFGEPARELGNELKGLLQELLRLHEEEVKDRMNQALAKALKGGQARIPATDLLKFKARAQAEK
jgi:hypothetical protein